MALYTSGEAASQSVDWFLVAKHVRSQSVSECCFQWLQEVQAEVKKCLKKSWKQEEVIDILWDVSVWC